MKHLVYTLVIIVLFISCKNDKKDIESGIQVSSKTIEQPVETEQPKIVIQNNPDLSGEFIEKYPNGNVKTEGWNNKSGERDKTWYSYYENGVKWRESNYKDGLKEGRSSVYFPSGKLRYSGFYTADKKTKSK